MAFRVGEPLGWGHLSRARRERTRSNPSPSPSHESGTTPYNTCTAKMFLQLGIHSFLWQSSTLPRARRERIWLRPLFHAHSLSPSLCPTHPPSFPLSHSLYLSNAPLARSRSVSLSLSFSRVRALKSPSFFVGGWGHSSPSSFGGGHLALWVLGRGHLAAGAARADAVEARAQPFG